MTRAPIWRDKRRSVAIGRPVLIALGLAHGYDIAFWWTAGILAGGSIVAGILFRRGPLVSQGTPSGQAAGEVEINVRLLLS